MLNNVFGPLLVSNSRGNIGGNVQPRGVSKQSSTYKRAFKNLMQHLKFDRCIETLWEAYTEHARSGGLADCLGIQGFFLRIRVGGLKDR